MTRRFVNLTHARKHFSSVARGNVRGGEEKQNGGRGGRGGERREGGRGDGLYFV